MHDAIATSYPYAADDDAEQYPSLPRVATAELTMHVMVDGEWHRRLPDLSATSCDKPYNAQFCPPRREELTGPLCATCFTPTERAKAQEHADKARAEAELGPRPITRTRKDTLR